MPKRISQSVETPVNTIIIGGGISGLVCAEKLARHGANVTVIESENKLGGLAQCYDDGTPKTYHHVLASDKPLLKTLKRLNIPIEWRKVKVGFHVNGKKYPFNRPFDLLRFDLLPFWDRIKFGSLILRTRHGKRNLNNISVKDWIMKEASAKIYGILIEPLIRSYYGSCDDISAEYLASRWRIESSSITGELGYVDVQRLIEKLREKILNMNGTIILNDPVRSLSRKDDKWFIHTSHHMYQTRVVISTVPTPILKDLYNHACVPRIRYKSVVCITFRLHKPASEYYWLVNLDRNSPVVSCLEHSNLNPTFKGGLVYAIAYCDPKDYIWKTPDGVLAQEWAKYLSRVFPDFHDAKSHEVFRSEYANPIWNVGFEFPPVIIEKGLFLAGTSRVFPDLRSMGGSIRTAHEALLEVLQNESLLQDPNSTNLGE